MEAVAGSRRPVATRSTGGRSNPKDVTDIQRAFLDSFMKTTLAAPLHGSTFRRLVAARQLWMRQVARNLTNAIDGFLRDARFLIHDRDPLFSALFCATLGAVGVETVKLPARSPPTPNALCGPSKASALVG